MSRTDELSDDQSVDASADRARSSSVQAGDLALLSWLWRSYLKPQRLWLGFALFFMAVEGSMLGALSYIIQPMFDEVFIAGDRSAVYWVAAAVGGIFVIRAVSAFSHRMLMQGAGLRIITTMQRDMVAHLMTLDSAYFQKNPPGTLIERVRGDTGAANMIWGVILSAAGRDLIGMIALLGVAISVDPLWTLVAVAGVPLLLGPVVALQRYVRKTTFRAREAAGRLSTRLDEIFHGVNTIKLNTSERRENNRFTEATDGYLKQEMKARAGQAGIPMMTDFVAAIGFAGVLVYGGNQIIDGDKTVGEFMSFFTAMGLLFEPVRRVANVTGAWQAARANLERIQEVFRSSPTISSPDTPARLATQPDEADIVFEDVVVVYGGEPALNGASFTAKAGQTTALVGASGAGKSTVFNVLTRLVDPSSGAVRIGGTPSGTLDLKDLRSLFSVVTQDAPMFDESLRDNIVLSTPGVDDARIEEAVAAANLSEFVARLPDGLDTPAGPRGSALSGGQKQRVAIARALLRRAPVLLLDEATSALDAESEVKVQEALDGLAQGRTTLVIAHRLSTVRKADKIIVMENGRVVDEGRHEELLERGGVYAKLHALQFDG
ncbi:ABC transporter ATP-binding protein [Kangsaoukella pontilimi]|uniref:ABC transporter ATP-binding protein n=1 Tax=Kangsaoukella pontilimi TaxID=2691042 RepID=UPI0029CA2554|nr:ABC transporter ATP-binding protein [Kangsaoukella pontilimi]